MRLEMTKKTDLALRILRYLECTTGTVSGSSLAAELDVTTYYLPQIVAPLARAGWVTATRGPHGGYRLVSSLADISVLDVVQAIEPMETDRCVLRGAPCPTQEQCAIHTSWAKARDALMEELGAASLDEALAPCS